MYIQNVCKKIYNIHTEPALYYHFFLIGSGGYCDVTHSNLGDPNGFILAVDAT